MTPQRQQFLLLSYLLVGTLLIGFLTYRPTSTPPITSNVETAPPPPPVKLVKQPEQRPVSEKKARFFARLTPLIEQQNQRILQLRGDIIALRQKVELGRVLTVDEQDALQRLARKYRLPDSLTDTLDRIDELLNRIDLVPTSLALAQAASESAWGESRFAREANNLYGQWCFSAGCGLVPQRRPEGMTHEVASYDSWQESVAAYFLNLNSHPAYQPLRDYRRQLRQQNLPLSGETLAHGLEKYSARGTSYVESLQRIIRVNNLARLDPVPAKISLIQPTSDPVRQG